MPQFWRRDEVERQLPRTVEVLGRAVEAALLLVELLQQRAALVEAVERQLGNAGLPDLETALRRDRPVRIALRSVANELRPGGVVSAAEEAAVGAAAAERLRAGAELPRQADAVRQFVLLPLAGAQKIEDG